MSTQERQTLDILNTQATMIRTQLSKCQSAKRRRFLSSVLREVQKTQTSIIESAMGR